MAERIEDLPSPRPIAPISHLVTSRTRPTFRWELGDSSLAVGVRLEICADRACTRRLQAVDATGNEVTLAADLPTGFVFWRLTTRTASGLGTTQGPTWVLYVEPASCPASPFVVRVDDYDGDGLPERPATTTGGVTITYSTGIPSSTFDGTPWSCTSEGTALRCYSADYDAGAGLGDISGDGYGDFVGYWHSLYRVGHTSSFDNHWVSLLGGPRGVFESGPFRDSVGRTSSGGPSVYAVPVGDIDRDGYGDVAATRGRDDFTAGVWRFLTRAGGDWSLRLDCGRERTFLVDVNGDSVGDVAVARCAPLVPPFRPYTEVLLGDLVARSFQAPLRLPGCTSVGFAPGTGEVTDARDVNCDGFSDLIVRTDGDARFVLLGGSDGLSSARCMALPAAP